MQDNISILEEQAQIFKALGHPSRLRMVEALQHGELCVCDLQGLVGDDMSTISRHLAVLRTARVVSSRREGTSMFYRLELNCLGNFLQCTREHVGTQSRTLLPYVKPADPTPLHAHNK